MLASQRRGFASFADSRLEKVGVSDFFRKKAVVAIARQLAVDLWRLFTEQTTGEKLGLIYQPEAA